jgi:hypothetical protein
MSNGQSNVMLAAANRLSSSWRHANGLLAAAACLMLPLAGCKMWGPSPPPESTHQESSVMSGLRKPGPPGQLLGVDARAREIEHNLGVR